MKQSNWKIHLKIRLKIIAFIFALVGWFMLVTVSLEQLFKQDLSSLENFVETSLFKWGIKIFVICLLILLIKGKTILDQYLKTSRILRIILRIIFVGGIVGWILGLGSLVIGAFLSENISKNVNDDKIGGFLEENLAWTNNPEGKAFCSYEEFGREENNVYLWAYCQEFYVQDKEIICPDADTREKCFASKEEDGCKSCNIKEVTPHLVQGGGVSAPIKITLKDSVMEMWQPRYGSLYGEDIEKTFPKEFADKALTRDINSNIFAVNLRKAEVYFDTEAIFETTAVLENDCTIVEDCPDLPFEYMVISQCPHQMACIESKCTAGCYDFFDKVEFPIIDVRN